MAEAGVLQGPSRSERLFDRLKTTAGVVAAVAGAVTGLWTIYEKAKAEARQYTAASYETLAPQVNQMGEALRKIEQENQRLKEALFARQGVTRPARPRATAPRAGTAAPATPAVPPAAPAAPATGEPPTVPPATAEGAPPAQPAAPATAAEREQDAFDRILGTMHQTKEAVDAVRKVPESFQKVLDEKKK